jgi:hypothetical protein
MLSGVIIDAVFGCAGRPDSRGRCVVLSDNERKTLLDVERRFMAEDPEFARSFHDQLRQQPARHGRSNGKIAVAVALLFSTILLLVGFPSGALACVITTGLICAMWSWVKDSDPERPDPGRG